MAAGEATNAAFEAAARYMAGLDEDKREAFLSRLKIRAAEATSDDFFEPPIRTLGQYLDDPIEVPPELVAPYILVRGGVSCTLGRAGKGKTVLNLNRMLRWSAGKPLFDGHVDHDDNKIYMPSKPLKGLVIENEGAGGLFHRQVGIMLHAEAYMSKEDRELARENLLVWGDGGYSGLKLDDPAKLDLVRRGCEKWEPDVVFVEPFRGLWNGEENSATDMAVVVDALVELATDYGCAVLLAHHERKSGVGDDGEKMSAGRGSTVLEGVVTLMENFESAKGGDQRELSTSKSRHGKAPNPTRMEWDPEAWWYKWVPTSSLEEGFLDALRNNADEPMSLKDLSEELNEPINKLRPLGASLAKEGKVKKMPNISTGEGSTGVRYRLPTSDGKTDSSYGGLSI